MATAKRLSIGPPQVSLSGDMYVLANAVSESALRVLDV